MSNAARNDQQARQIIAALLGFGATPENITRFLNYHYADTFQLDRDRYEKAVIHRVHSGDNFAPSIEIWRQS